MRMQLEVIMMSLLKMQFLAGNETSPSSFSFSNKIFLAGLSSGSESVQSLLRVVLK